MTELRARMNDPGGSLDVGEARADGEEEFFRVLASAGKIGAEGGADLTAGAERTNRQGNEAYDMPVFHRAKVQWADATGEGEASPKGVLWRPLCKRLHISPVRLRSASNP